MAVQLCRSITPSWSFFPQNAVPPNLVLLLTFRVKKRPSTRTVCPLSHSPKLKTAAIGSATLVGPTPPISCPTTGAGSKNNQAINAVTADRKTIRDAISPNDTLIPIICLLQSGKAWAAYTIIMRAKEAAGDGAAGTGRVDRVKDNFDALSRQC